MLRRAHSRMKMVLRRFSVLGSRFYFLTESEAQKGFYHYESATGGFVRVQEAALLHFATTCFEKVGLDHDHAALISRLLVNADLRGVRGHGARIVNLWPAEALSRARSAQSPRSAGSTRRPHR